MSYKNPGRSTPAGAGTGWPRCRPVPVPLKDLKKRCINKLFILEIQLKLFKIRYRESLLPVLGQRKKISRDGPGKKNLASLSKKFKLFFQIFA